MATAPQHGTARYSRGLPRYGEARLTGRLSSPLASTTNVYVSYRATSSNFICKDVVDRYPNLCYCISRKRYFLRHVLSEYNMHNLSCRWLEFKKQQPPCYKARKMVQLTPFASTDDGVAVNGTPQARTSGEMEEMRVKLSQSLQGEDLSLGLVQAVHDAARAVELAFLEHNSSSKTSWFSKAWLGLDKNAWLKTLSYQAAVNSLLQAAIEISSRGDARDRDINIFVRRSLLRQCAPLESVIQEELSSKQPASYDWFWSHQHPMVVSTFVNLFEKDPCFSAATTLYWKGRSSSSGTVNDLSLLMLALSCLAAVTKLGSAKVSCSHFFSIVPDITGRLMDMLLDFIPIEEAYSSMKDIGLRREFLYHFGPRAATSKFKNDQGVEEVAFWVHLVQKQLQQAIDRERMWSRLTTCESIEILERDLAIFGFFVALGRSTQSFLSSNGFTIIDHPIESIISYLIGGSVLYYPQLSSITSYQLYVEVVCEELEWLPFYQSNFSSLNQKLESKEKCKEISEGEAISRVLDVCSYWMTSFIKYSSWLEDPSNVKAVRFLATGHSKITECRNELGMLKNGRQNDTGEHKTQQGSGTYFSVETELDSFDKALESVEEALNRLEDLLQELHLANSNSGKEHLKAACSDLERIRKLKKEAEFLEASFRAKAASLEEEDAGEQSSSSVSERRRFSNMEAGKASTSNETDRSPAERVISKPHGFWSFLVKNSTRKADSELSTVDQNVSTAKIGNGDSESNEIRRFELLRHELIELEQRVQRSTEETENTEDLDLIDDEGKHTSAKGHHMLVKAQKKESVIAKSINKLKETSTDVWQGTQLLAIDVAAAMVLLKRALTGDELTEKEKKALQRTSTDLASVVPIGFLMLLPVTAVGHAAMLAAIQRYVPALIPSTYAPERLDLLRQLEKMKEMDTTEINSDETTVAVNSSSGTPENL